MSWEILPIQLVKPKQILLGINKKKQNKCQKIPIRQRLKRLKEIKIQEELVFFWLARTCTLAGVIVHQIFFLSTISHLHEDRRRADGDNWCAYTYQFRVLARKEMHRIQLSIIFSNLAHPHTCICVYIHNGQGVNQYIKFGPRKL